MQNVLFAVFAGLGMLNAPTQQGGLTVGGHLGGGSDGNSQVWVSWNGDNSGTFWRQNAWVRVDGRLVEVRIRVVRRWSGSPWMMAPSRVEAELRTNDPRGLPQIKELKLKMQQAKSKWEPKLRLTGVSGGVASYAADGGPMWRPGSVVRSGVEIKSGKKTAKTTVQFITVEAEST